MKVVAFGTYDATAHPRIQVLVDGLRERGIDVLEIDEPLGLDTAQRVGMLRQPWRLPLLAAKLGRRWLSLARRSRRLGRDEWPSHVLVGYLGHFDVLLARVLFPSATIVLDHLIFAAGTARDRGVDGGVRTVLLSGLDRLAIAAADVVVTDTEEHAAQVPERRRKDTVVVPVGATRAWFDAGARATAGADGDPLGVVFFGLFTPLQGAPVIAETLRLLDRRGVRVRATLAGSGQDAVAVREILAAIPPGGTVDVTWRDWVESAELPGLVAAHDVCLGIFGATAKALAVVPNKVYQGAAAGCAVVTSDTEPQRRAFGDAAVFVPPGDAAALAEAIATVADRAVLVRTRAAGRAAAQRFTAGAVVAPLVDALDSASATSRR
ncbi:glycosyltransferase [Jiangella alkaliphila]|uniref:Glycosyltransferase involved in cell wall bisynthesis n=1 Tax=Jiangella alkaliphila TaxID=419479 RepID=A0A1H2J6T8_9ACTN|nr:glycosyltransferase [Jiangella alkaliphila]SDU51911.1 Glycosyltransferase involved in cell wall bisynthesis [Jiangella alkaliphila]